MKQTILQLKSKKTHLKVHPLNFKKVFNETEKKIWLELSEWTSK